MPLTITWHDIALRLAVTLLAGGVIGYNRSERGRPAGMRTTLLVCLTASLSMILTNELLATRGKLPDSFAQFDVMRLPLGILSGMGFIGAGTILRKQDLVLGVTTAATLWFVTMLGICIGAGAIGLGLIGLALAYLILWLLKHMEHAIPSESRGKLLLVIADSGPSDESLKRRLESNVCRVVTWAISRKKELHQREISCELLWHTRAANTVPPPSFAEIEADPACLSISWQPEAGTGRSE